MEIKGTGVTKETNNFPTLIKVFIVVFLILSFFVVMKRYGDEQVKKEQTKIQHDITRLDWQLRNLK